MIDSRLRIAAAIIWVLCYPAMSRAATNAPDGNSAAAPDLSRCEPNKPYLGFILRQDFTDISLLSCPNDGLKNAVGTRVTLTFDELAHTTAVSVDGLAAGVVRILGDKNPGNTFLGVVFGPYLQGNEMYQFESSTKPSKTVDTLTAGGYVEFGFDNPFIPQAANYYRIRGGEQFGNSGIGSNTFVSEWLPVYETLHIGTPYFIPGTIFGFQCSPELMAQYDQLEYGPNKYLLFSKDNDAFRIGPEVVLKLFLDPRLVLDEPFHAIAEHASVSITYHASWDTYSGRDYSWLQTTLTYNLNDAGNFALSASYGYGNAEATANMTSQIKVGLAAKY
jgi:hypothetical protein